MGLGTRLTDYCVSKSLILALGYGTDCTIHLYDIGQFHIKKKHMKKKKQQNYACTTHITSPVISDFGNLYRTEDNNNSINDLTKIYSNTTCSEVENSSQLITGSALTQLKFCHTVWLIWSMADRERDTGLGGYHTNHNGECFVTEEMKVYSLQNSLHIFYCRSHLHECTCTHSFIGESK